MEIKVGEYVRTIYGIFKVAKIDGLYIYLDKEYFDKQYQTMRDVTFKERIVKHSFNIKELIEEGDIVNESLIVYRGKVASGKEKLLVGNHIINGMSLEVANIKSILAHEQYERNCYRLEEE